MAAGGGDGWRWWLQEVVAAALPRSSQSVAPDSALLPRPLHTNEKTGVKSKESLRIIK